MMRATNTFQALCLGAALGLTGCVSVHHDHEADRYERYGDYDDDYHGPPPHAPAHGYRYRYYGADHVYDGNLGVYTVIGYPDLWFHDGFYYRHHRNGYWERCNRLRGGHWGRADYAYVPKRLHGRYPDRGGRDRWDDKHERKDDRHERVDDRRRERDERVEQRHDRVDAQRDERLERKFERHERVDERRDERDSRNDVRHDQRDERNDIRHEERVERKIEHKTERHERVDARHEQRAEKKADRQDQRADKQEQRADRRDDRREKNGRGDYAGPAE